MFPPASQLWNPKKSQFISFFFQVQEHNGKCWFWLSGEVLMPINPNLNPFRHLQIGGKKGFPCGELVEKDC